MTTVAETLGRAKQSMLWEAMHGGVIVEQLRDLVYQSDFHLTDETKWAYAKVATFLEDGWTSMSSYTQLQPSSQFSLDEVGRVINKLVGGTRYDQRDADRLRIPCTQAGAWPTKADVAAFFLYINCSPPQ